MMMMTDYLTANHFSNLKGNYLPFFLDVLLVHLFKLKCANFASSIMARNFAQIVVKTITQLKNRICSNYESYFGYKHGILIGIF